MVQRDGGSSRQQCKGECDPLGERDRKTHQANEQLPKRLLKEYGWPSAFRKAEYLKALEQERLDAKRKEAERKEEAVRKHAQRRFIAVDKTYDLRSKNGSADSTAK